MGKKILLISYHFPPDSSVGGLRVAKFAKNLPSFGWEPYVLTVKDSYCESLDGERLKDVKDVKTFRTIELPTIRGVYLWFKSLYNGKKEREQKKITAEHQVTINKDTFREKISKKLKRYFISLFAMLPDEKRSWVIPATVRAFFEIRRRKIDCIMTSSPPHSVQIIGLLLKKITNVKWAADFRDPWIDILDFKSPFLRCALSDRIERWLEKMVIRNADAFIVTADGLKNLLQERYPDIPSEKFVCIPNGIDMSKFTLLKEVKKFERFTITYTGTIYETRTPEPLFDAVRELIARDRIKESDIRIKLVGNCRNIKGKETRSIVQSYGLESVVEISDPVPYPEALEIMRRSHLLLLLAQEQPLAIPAKVYDYLGSGTQILALTEAGATAELIKLTNSGRCFARSDINDMGDYICEVMNDNRNPAEFNNRTERYERFDVMHLTKQLADELSSICNSNNYTKAAADVTK